MKKKSEEIRRLQTAPKRFHNIQGEYDIPENNDADEWANIAARDACDRHITTHFPIDSWSQCRLRQYHSHNPVENHWCRQGPEQATRLWDPP